jgi:hypothetical protein
LQAILILAHKNIDQVIELSNILKDNFEIYIHIDKKTKLTNYQENELKDLKVNYISTQNVNWGAWSVVQATIDLLKLALKDKKISNFHLISGQDWPTRSPKEIYDFFEKNQKLYIWNYQSSKYKKAGEPLVCWQKYYFNYDKINRRSLYGKIYHRLSILLQTLFHIDKLKKYNVDLTLYNGSQWVDLPRDACEYLIDFIGRNPNIIKMFQTGFCSDEFWIPTILRNNDKFAPRIDTNNHRYIDWHKKNGSMPALLDQDDYDKIKKSNSFFMRKVEIPVSEGLIRKIENDW